MLDHRVRDLRQATVTLRNDLRFTPQSSGTEPSYVVEDTVNSKFFRIGYPEYVFVSLLDGRTSIAEAIQLTATALPAGGLSDQDAAAVCKWLLDNGLAVRNTNGGGRLTDDGPKKPPSWNPIAFRVPLAYPDRLFDRITPLTGWLFGPAIFALWCLLLGWASYELLAQWPRFTSSSQRIFAPDNWLWLIVCWLMLKVVHELSHGIACKKYRGMVRELGVFFILLTPLAYVDVTTSWRFRSVWHRILTASAGMYVELAIGAAALIGWSRSSPGVTSDILFNVATMASLTTILINANPLMRFDGYYILSDLVGIPNLYPQGRQYLHYWCRRYLCGVSASPPQASATAGVIIRVYGVAAFCWQIVICIGLLFGASKLFHGAGLAIAVAAAMCWVIRPLVGITRYVLFGKPGERPKRGRFALIMCSGTAVLSVALMIVPWPGATRAPAIVQYEPLSIVRTDSDGFVAKLAVDSGDVVEKDAVIAVLKNDELAASLADVELQIAQSRIRSRQQQRQQKMAAWQAEEANRLALEQKRNELRRQLDKLVLRSPVAGKVIGRDLATRVGTYVERGTEICSIGVDGHKELHVSISQDDLDRFTSRVGETVHVRLAGHGSWPTSLLRIDPRATQDPQHAAFCAPNGGPLAVTLQDDQAEGDADRFEFVAPRFVGHVALSSAQSGRLRAGQLATVKLTETEPIGPWLYHRIRVWVRDSR